MAEISVNNVIAVCQQPMADLLWVAGQKVV